MAITLEVKVSKPVLDFVHLKVYPAPSLLYSGTSDCRREFFSPTTYPGQGWPVRKSFKYGMVRVMPHISQWSLSWQTMASPWLQISAMHLDSRHSARQRQAGWQIHSLRSPGGKMGMHRVGFSQKQVISLKTFTVVFMCAEVVPALCHSALCPLDLPCTQAQLICSVSQ